MNVDNGGITVKGRIWIIGSLLFLIVCTLSLSSYINNKQNVGNASQVVHSIGELFANKKDLTTDDISLVQSMFTDVDNLVYFGMYKYPKEQKVEQIKFIEVEKLEKVLGSGVRHSGNNNKFYGFESENWFLEWKLQK